MKLQVLVTNRTALILNECHSSVTKLLDSYWSYAHPKYKFVKRARPGWDGIVHLFRNNELPSGLFWATKKLIEEETNIKFEVQAELEKPMFTEEGLFSEGKWSFQNDCVNAMIKVARFGGGTIVNATGSGKTRIAAMLASRLRGNFVFIVDQLVLQAQAKADFEKELGEEIGYIGNSEFVPRRVTVATRQTMFLHRKDKDFRRWSRTLDVMVIDEIHEQMNKSNFALIEAILPKTVYGLTATLQLRKKFTRLKVWSLTGPQVFSYPLTQGQDDDVLSRGIVVRVIYENKISEYEHKKEGWSGCYKEKIVFNNERNWMMADFIKRAVHRGYFVVCLVTRVSHLKQLSKRLGDLPHRIVSGTYDGASIKIQDRMASKQDFERGIIKVILANTVFKKGVNIKRLDFIIDGAAQRSEDDAIQKFGRGLRQHKDKQGLLHFDIADIDHDNKKNWLATASKDRKKAFKRSGVIVKQVVWDDYEGTAKRIFNKAEAWLQEELDR